METNRAGNLDESARWQVVIFKKARAENTFVDGASASGRDNPATEQTSSPSDAARNRSGMTAESKNCDRREAVAGQSFCRRRRKRNESGPHRPPPQDFPRRVAAMYRRVASLMGAAQFRAGWWRLGCRAATTPSAWSGRNEGRETFAAGEAWAAPLRCTSWRRWTRRYSSQRDEFPPPFENSGDCNLVRGSLP
jgi:hypothetical protein